MSRSKCNFIIGISLLMACIIAVGCLPNKQGGFTCICAPAISKFKSLLPMARKSSPSDSQPVAVPLSEQGSIPVSSILDLPEVVSWEKYPDTAEETQSLNAALDGFKQALADGNVGQAVQYIYDEKQQEYRQLFQSDTGMMPVLANLLDGAEISFLSARPDPEATSSERIAEYRITIDGVTFYITFIKIGDKWLLHDL